MFNRCYRQWLTLGYQGKYLTERMVEYFHTSWMLLLPTRVNRGYNVTLKSVSEIITFWRKQHVNKIFKCCDLNTSPLLICRIFWKNWILYLPKMSSKCSQYFLFFFFFYKVLRGQKVSHSQVRDLSTHNWICYNLWHTSLLL